MQPRSYAMGRPGARRAAPATRQVLSDKRPDRCCVGVGHCPARARNPAAEMLCGPNVLMDRDGAVAVLRQPPKLDVHDTGQGAILQSPTNVRLPKESIDHDTLLPLAREARTREPPRLCGDGQASRCLADQRKRPVSQA